MKAVRRMFAFVVMLPVWPLAVIAAVIDDEAEVSEIISGAKTMWRRIYES